MKKYIVVIISILFVFLVLTGCSQSLSRNESGIGKEKLNIYTTIFPLQDFSEKIGGKYVQVENIVPTGSDAHSFEPSTKTMVKISEGDAFVYLGTGIEGFTDAVIEAVKNEQTKIVKASEGVALIDSNGIIVKEKAVKGDVDPHVWLDPNRAIQLAENIKNVFIEIKPEQEEYFEENFKKLKEELEILDLSFKKMVRESSNKNYIVAHSAFGYWEDAYGLEQIGISGLSPSNEPSQKQLEEIIKAAKKQEIKYILFEQNVENKVAEVLKKEIGAETLTLHNLEALNEEDIKKNEDYISIMEKNIETLRKALDY
ncbi:metal ABC transporter solute-binding protein, Zn/Mn family [Niallia sp. Sow4_A1]|uniref:Zinc ABC transporter substrate-binding protein n=1 Tax=Niallia hominis TaxID=3133173 RepID=A0ABV1F124_9BACI|nr:MULTISPECIES: zinc ABC transporter substrate-binding protein [Bacillaceae]MCM3364413.1 zinc ABC transporter substrate-binding protein [Niallia sp. MER TA 168]